MESKKRLLQGNFPSNLSFSFDHNHFATKLFDEKGKKGFPPKLNLQSVINGHKLAGWLAGKLFLFLYFFPGSKPTVTR